MLENVGICKGGFSYLAWFMILVWGETRKEEIESRPGRSSLHKIQDLEKTVFSSFLKLKWTRIFIILCAHHLLSLGKSRSQHAHYWTLNKLCRQKIIEQHISIWERNHHLLLIYTLYIYVLLHLCFCVFVYLCICVFVYCKPCVPISFHLSQHCPRLLLIPLFAATIN